jgi:hypothetical protein
MYFLVARDPSDGDREAEDSKDPEDDAGDDEGCEDFFPPRARIGLGCHILACFTQKVAYNH